jgi:curved DNA-binding protein CbpA
MRKVFGCSKLYCNCSPSPLIFSPNSFYTQRRLFSQTLIISRHHYDVLGVPHDADVKLIKSQFYKLSKKYHPDANIGDKTASSKFVRINEAYSILSKEQSRREYDYSIRHQLNKKPSNSYNSYRPHTRYRGNNAGVYSGTTGRSRSGFNFHNKQQKGEFNFQEHYQRHYGEELRRAKSEVHKEKEKNIRDSLDHKQSQKTIRLGLLIFVTVVLGTGGQIFAQEFPRDELFIIK